MRRRGWVTIGVAVMAVAAGWLLRDFWLPWLPVWGDGLKIWAAEWGTAVQTLADILATLALIGGGAAAWLGLRGNREGGLRSISVTMPDTERAGVLRAEMREKVRRMWVEGVLHKSLYHDLLIELGMKREDGRVSQRPWQTVIHLSNQADHPLPPGRSLAKVFAETNRGLLILGEPGAGKTTEMLALVEEVLDGQEATSAAYVPVVFNLSSWAEKQLPLDQWLVEELRRNYGASRTLAENWVAGEALGLFLDGLDEVAKEARDGCVAAINAYRTEHGFVPLCVCCRRGEYEALALPMALGGAVVLSPMTRGEVVAYLERLGGEVEGLAQALEQNEAMWDLAETPLGLNILTMTYHGKSRAKVEASLGEENLERQLFAAYVEQMLVRTARTEQIGPIRYTREKTLRWLGWLAYQMRRHGQSIFLIEHLQPDWHNGTTWRLFLCCVLICVSIFGLLFGLAFELRNASIAALFFGLIYGSSCYRINLREPLTLSHSLSKSDLFLGLLLALTAGLLLGLSVGSWVPVIYGSIAGLTGILISPLIRKPKRIDQISETVYPNQGIWICARNGLIQVLILGLLVGWGISMYWGLGIGISFGLIIGLSGGWDTVIGHVVLRWLFYRAGVMPWQYFGFLDYATERIFLRKVGGGYVFVHRLLLDYLADRYEESTSRKHFTAEMLQ